MRTPPPEPPGAPPAVANTLLFRTLLKGREKKLGRPLSDAERAELVLHCQRAEAAGVQPASQPPRPDVAVRAAVQALPKALPALARHSDGHVPAQRVIRRRMGQAITDVTKLMVAARREGHFGRPHLPAYARRDAALHIQQEDLDLFIPDGWGQLFRSESAVLARAVGLPPAAVPLLCLLTWTSSFRPASRKDRHECGAGFQVSLDWLSRKLGVSRVWVQALINRLDPCAPWRRECALTHRENRRRRRKGQVLLPLPPRPPGTIYIHRFRRLKRFADLHPDGEQRPVWFDATGRARTHVDIRGLIYLTVAGRRVLGAQRHSPDQQRELERDGYRARWKLSARLRRGHDPRGGRLTEVLENRRELHAAPGLPENLSPNHSYSIPPRQI